MSDIASTSMAAPLPRKSRGANPSTDYKALFLKSKDKYDRVSSEHTELKASVVKASAKHQKLREELDYILDAVAAKREQRAQIEQSHREHALELEREAAAAVAAAEAAWRRRGSAGERERETYESRSANRGYEGEEEHRSYASRYAQPSYHAFGSGIGRGYASSPPPPIQSAAAAGAGNISVLSQRGGHRYSASEASPQGPERRGSYAASSYRQAPSRSPPAPSASSSSRRPYEHDSPSKYDTQQRYRESTPPLASSIPSSAVKRPRPTSVERELLEADAGYHSKRARND